MCNLTPNATNDPVLPIIHLNGTSADELVRARQKAIQKLDEALQALAEMRPHGRDYYLEEGRLQIAEAQHTARMREVTAVRDDITREMTSLLGYL